MARRMGDRKAGARQAGARFCPLDPGARRRNRLSATRRLRTAFVFPRAYPDTAANATKLELMASAISADLARRANAAGLAGPRFDPCPRPLPRWPREFVQHGLEREPKQWLAAFGLAPPSPEEIEAFEKAEAAELAVRLEEATAFAAKFAEATRRAPRPRSVDRMANSERPGNSNIRQGGR